MNLGYYQEQACSTAIYPEAGTHNFQGLVYCALKLAGEAGEVAQHIGKAIRDDGSHISMEREENIAYELGDVLWYIANMANELGLTLDNIAEMNLQKLVDRKARNVLSGSGDNR